MDQPGQTIKQTASQDSQSPCQIYGLFSAAASSFLLALLPSSTQKSPLVLWKTSSQFLLAEQALCNSLAQSISVSSQTVSAASAFLLTHLNFVAFCSCFYYLSNCFYTSNNRSYCTKCQCTAASLIPVYNSWVLPSSYEMSFTVINI